MNIQSFKDAFEKAADPVRGERMQAYLKGQFPFYGLQAGERRKLQNEIFRLENARKEPLDLEFIRLCWNEEMREFQYLAIDYLRMKQRELTADHLPFVLSLIESKSWWDTVDMLAVMTVGGILEGKQDLIEEYADAWIGSDNFWLRRTAILYQLKYKDEIDYDRLMCYCLKLQDEKEFFIRKAIGWMLREASKSNPAKVKMILENGQFSGLTIREASKYLDK